MDHDTFLAPGPLRHSWGQAVSAESLRRTLAAPDHALPVPAATDRQFWDATTGRIHPPTLADVLERAGADRSEEWPQVPARGYARYVRDGQRTEHERRVFARQRRLSRATVAAAVTLAPEWLDEVADGILLLCEQTSWCWPAHDDAYARHGDVLPNAQDPFLDLGAGEVAGQLAWVDHVLGTHLDERVPGLRERIRHEVETRVFTPFMQRRDWHWLVEQVHNWNPWIHQNLITAALVLLDEGERRAQIVATAIAGLDLYVAAIPADGAIDEGFDYWWNGACRCLEALALISHATGDRLRATDVPALRATITFPYAMYLGDGWCYSFSDCQPRLLQEHPWYLLHRWAQLAGDEDSRRFALSRRPHHGPLVAETEGLGRLLLGLADHDWATSPTPAAVQPRSHFFSSTQVLIAHDGAQRLSLAAKGGHNAENHNHNDVGSVSVALAGVPALIDLGRATYTAQTFGPHRYQLWYIRSDWHNVPQLAGYDQGAGAGFQARDAAAQIDTDQIRFDLDLTHAYPAAAHTQWHRRISMRDGAVTIADSWRTENPSEPHRLHWILAGTIADHRPGRLDLDVLDEAGTLRLEWDPTLATSAVETRDLDDPYLRAAWGMQISRLVLTPAQTDTCSLTITPLRERAQLD